jgi:hypothetical protein
MAPPRVQTTLVRGLAVGEAAVIAAIVLAFALWSALNSFATSTDVGSGPISQLFHFIYSTRSLTTGLSKIFTSTFGFAPDASTAATGVSYFYVQDLLVLLASLAPLTLAASFWQALRRLTWERFGAVWFTAFLTNVWLLLLLACVVSAESFGLAALQGQPDVAHRTPFWAVLWLAGLPGSLAVLLALALLSSLLGVAAATFFAPRPVPRPARPALGTAPLPPPVVLCTLLVAVLQVAAYALLHATLMKGTGVAWDWFPLGALLILAASALGTSLPDVPRAPLAAARATS